MESPAIAGLLYKRRGGFGKIMPNAWQYRFFSISKEGILCYYDTEMPDPHDKPRGRIDLDVVDYELITDQHIEGAPTAFTIQICPVNDEKWKLCADTKEDHARWVAMLEKHRPIMRDPRGYPISYTSDDDKDPKHAAAAAAAAAQRSKSLGFLKSPIAGMLFDHQARGSESGVGGHEDFSNADKRRSSHFGDLYRQDGIYTSFSEHNPATANTSMQRPNLSDRALPQLNSPHSTTQPQQTASPVPTARPGSKVAVVSKKSGLRLSKQSKHAGQEWWEWIMAMIILNTCILCMSMATQFIVRMAFLFVANMVIGRTLNLRAKRKSPDPGGGAGAAGATGSVSTSTLVAAQSERSSNSLNSSLADGGRGVSVVGDSAAVGSAVGTGAAGAGAAGGGGGGPAVSGEVGVLVGTDQNGARTVRFEETVPDGEAAVVPISASGKPIAGATFAEVTTPQRQSPDHTWSKCDHRIFNVRVGPEYNRYKKKAPSGPPLYDCFALDVFCAKTRMDHVVRRFEIPESLLTTDTHNEHVPPVMVVQLQIPSEPPASFFTSSDDGPGWAIVMYYRITEDSLAQLKDLQSASPAIKLWSEYCKRAFDDPAWRGRFKVINSCTNLDELGIPSTIAAYNAKPVLIRRTGTLFKGPGYIEMDIHVHKFATLAKQSIYLLSSRCGLMYMQIGFVIEGREDSELPETLFGCVAVNKPQEENAGFIFDEDG